MSASNNRSASVKVGLLTLVSLFVLVTTVIWLRGRGLGGGENFDVYFHDVDGIREGAPVQFMGIRVGFVNAVAPVITANKEYKVHINFTLTEPNINVPKGSVISLEQSGIIGEKFLEIMPPKPVESKLVFRQAMSAIDTGLPVYVSFKQGLTRVGEVTDVVVTEIPKITRPTPDFEYKVRYVTHLPGYLPPNSVDLVYKKDSSGAPFLLIDDTAARWSAVPSKDLYFSLEEPLRMKEFLEEQLASAQALEMTNERINRLLSDETISTIQDTLKNSELLTEKAAVVLGHAETLFASTSRDIHTLVASANTLTTNVVAVSNNVNQLVGDPELKANIHKTVASVEKATASLSEILDDPELQHIVSDTRVTSQNAAEVMAYLKHATVDNDLQGRMNESLTLLNQSLTHLSSILESVDGSGPEKDSLKAIVRETKATSENLNKFSEKLNKHFLLFRLLF